MYIEDQIALLVYATLAYTGKLGMLVIPPYPQIVKAIFTFDYKHYRENFRIILSQAAGMAEITTLA